VSGKPFRGFESHPLRQFERGTMGQTHASVRDIGQLRFVALRLTRQAGFLTALAIILALGATVFLSSNTAAGQHTARHRAKRGSICGNPKVTCKTTVTFHEYDLPFHVPANAVIWDSELFYAIILTSVPASEGDCNAFIAETDRREAQSLFPNRKVFSSRCIEPGEMFYTNVSEKHRIMAVYAGTTLGEAKRTLAAVKNTGKFPDAYVRRMRTGFNGT
jgi:hypothetical protein